MDDGAFRRVAGALRQFHKRFAPLTGASAGGGPSRGAARLASTSTKHLGVSLPYYLAGRYFAVAMTPLLVPPAGLAALDEWLRGRRLRAREWRRVEVVRRSASGETVPRIARALGLHEQTARQWVARYLEEGPAGLADRPRSGGPRRVGDAALEAACAQLDVAADSPDGRSWTRGQLAAWLGEERGVRVSADRLGRLLRRRGYRYKRTKRTVAHKRRDLLLQASRRADLELLRF
jgi:transposase